MGELRLICHRCGKAPPRPGLVLCPTCNVHLISEREHAKAPRDSFLGTTLGGRYPILGLIGVGGMGAVYRSVQPMVERPVAIKVILPSLSQGDPEVQQRFLREGQTIARLDHPSLVTLYDFGVEPDGTLFMVMELVQGKTLNRLFKKGALTTRALLAVTQATLGGLAEAHGKGIIHRDLKPENIMVLPEDPFTAGQPVRVKVLDFGLVKLVGAASMTRLTRAGAVSGTPRYMAPEQAASREVDQRTDLYSLAALLYEGLSGRAPFEGATPLAIITARLTQPAPPLPNLPHITPELRRIIETNLATNPAERFPSALAMAEAIAALRLDARADLPLPAVGKHADSVPSGGAAQGPSLEQLSAAAASLAPPKPAAVGPLPSAAQVPAASAVSVVGPGSTSQPPGRAITDDESRVPTHPSGTASTPLIAFVSSVGAAPPAETAPALAPVAAPADGEAPTAPASPVTSSAVDWEPPRRSSVPLIAGVVAGVLLVGGIGVWLGLSSATSSGSHEEADAGSRASGATVASVDLGAVAEDSGEAVAAPRTTQHRIESEPRGAAVYVDGRRIGSTPLDHEVPNDAGEATEYELRLAGWRSETVRMPNDGDAHAETVRLARIVRRPKPRHKPRPKPRPKPKPKPKPVDDIPSL